MAQSPSHKFGQIIGDMLETMIYGPLKDVSTKHGLYLDFKHARAARDNRKKVCWKDNKGNNHDLDYVLEAEGNENRMGIPKAFIESAWRRYTKHSRNKVQEMQSAIVPLAQTYSDYHPFLGVVLAGVFTDGSLRQLRSHGFKILYFPYESIISAFACVGIDAEFGEDTPDAEIQKKVSAYESLTERQRKRIRKKLLSLHERELGEFLDSLSLSLNRSIERVHVLTLHGDKFDVSTVEEAVQLVQAYDENTSASCFVRYEIIVRYSNGDRVTGEFEEKQGALGFLSSMT